MRLLTVVVIASSILVAITGMVSGPSNVTVAMLLIQCATIIFCVGVIRNYERRIMLMCIERDLERRNERFPPT